ncbi:tRNA 2-selenouridine(34) synthase MnmH [uncultured Propionivibrio sp.]|uniref:tRNA 2-selenouridine(34) synthase MnmH n=1 Tax=uncultured Propionivibrio sp. TaxID=426737 RepID=UPI0029BFB865|nr:tRNA 2-selenouridine(34) synthase MnmH [uncultured Propionivibrio sp.]
MKNGIAGIDERDAFDDIIDVRTPAEFAEDHIPGAINCPVLDNDQRIEIGTMYKQLSPFEAKKLGAAYIAESIARHLRESFLTRPRQWRPLIMCWRGGERSGAMTHVLRRIGWNAAQLDGGYKSYRRHVIDQLETLPAQFHFTVVGGATGNGKSRLLQALARQGQQVLDLEALACHKGSVLGVLPDTPQPSQKRFETLLLATLARLDPARPVYVEAESRKIGQVFLPTPLLERIRASACLCIDAPFDARVDFLLRDYDYFVADPNTLDTRLDALRDLHSRETLAKWKTYAHAGEWRTLVAELLQQHYDPLYQRSQARNFSGFGTPKTYAPADLDDASIDALAARIVGDAAALPPSS